MVDPGWRTGLTVEEERRAITDLAVQQLTERSIGKVRPPETLSAPVAPTDAEDMRNKALADMLERQQRLATEQPVSKLPPGQAGSPVVQRTSGTTISPSLTVKPTLTSSRPASAPDLAEVAEKSRRKTASRHRPAAREAEPEGHWRALAELADLLAEEVFPLDALPEVSRWLAGRIRSTVTIMLLGDGVIDVVAPWPGDDPVAAGLTDLVGQPLDQGSTMWAAMSEGRTITGEIDDLIVVPDDGATAGVGGWAAVPMVDRSIALGTLLVTRDPDDTIPDATVQLVEEVARRVARALLNCEEAANAETAADREMPVLVKDQLGALVLVLEAFELLPRPPLALGHKRQFTEITRNAVALRTRVSEFLSGQSQSSQDLSGDGVAGR
ncbi:MAG: hypothetical protein M3083_19585 [Actinomycetota bacterium]|nr:hypothetical protein [Actinomycetota bacterium]